MLRLTEYIQYVMSGKVVPLLWDTLLKDRIFMCDCPLLYQEVFSFEISHWKRSAIRPPPQNLDCFITWAEAVLQHKDCCMGNSRFNCKCQTPHFLLFQSVLVHLKAFQLLLMKGSQSTWNVQTGTETNMKKMWWYMQAYHGRARLMIDVIWFISMAIIIPELVVLDTRRSLPSFTILLTSCR